MAKCKMCGKLLTKSPPYAYELGVISYCHDCAMSYCSTNGMYSNAIARVRLSSMLQTVTPRLRGAVR
ncbi:MAG TPA: hypothetical protein DG761_09890 [Gammaproteobacteria bacterium]|nr:hypothetical protein [Gammaproteobacteria bacterium]